MSTRRLHLSSRLARHLKVTVAVTACVVAVTPAAANPVTLITDRSEIFSVETLTWDAVGKVLDPLMPNPADFLPSAFSLTTGRGLGVQVEVPPLPMPISPPLVFQTLQPPLGIPTNFAAGDFVLFTGAQFGVFPAPGNPGPISIRFDEPVRAAGAQVAVDDVLTYNLTLSVFDAFDNLLDAFTIAGTSSTALDDTAAFLGAAADAAIIGRLEFGSSESERALGLNQLSLRHDVAEPPWLLLVGLILMATAYRPCGRGPAAD